MYALVGRSSFARKGSHAGARQTQWRGTQRRGFVEKGAREQWWRGCGEEVTSERLQAGFDRESGEELWP